VDRPGFLKLMEDSDRDREAGDTTERCIVVERMDRLARDLMVSEMLLRECRKRGIKVFSADQGLVDISSNDGDPSRKLIRQIMGAVAEWEKSVLVKKLYAARRRRAAERGQCEGPKPFGLGGVREKRIVQRMQMLQITSADTFSQIAEKLNAEGHKTRFGHRWTKGAVYAVLTRPETKKICEEISESSQPTQ
jgi:DNA invertase Pin-like site-specific DNA recombinase